METHFNQKEKMQGFFFPLLFLAAAYQNSDIIFQNSEVLSQDSNLYKYFELLFELLTYLRILT